MVRLEQEASVDLLEEREKLVPPDLLDPLDLLDSPLVPFTLRTVGHNCGFSFVMVAICLSLGSRWCCWSFWSSRRHWSFCEC